MSCLLLISQTDKFRQIYFLEIKLGSELRLLTLFFVVLFLTYPRHRER